MFNRSALTAGPIAVQQRSLFARLRHFRVRRFGMAMLASQCLRAAGVIREPSAKDCVGRSDSE
jgi:hypothetical protein